MNAPKIPTGMQMLAKQFGFDPAEIMKQVTEGASQFQQTAQTIADRLTAIDTKLGHLDAKLDLLLNNPVLNNQAFYPENTTELLSQPSEFKRQLADSIRIMEVIPDGNTSGDCRAGTD